MVIKIHNTLTRKKEIFKPIKRDEINFFVCGPTAYSYAHIGNFKTYTQFDIIVNYLRHRKFKVNYIQNLTDIDDKIIHQAKESKEDPLKLSEKFCKIFIDDMESLDNTAVSKYIKATERLSDIISQVERLLKKEFAYQTSDGIYFNLEKNKDYGKLSGRTVLQAEDATTRVDHSKEKKNKGDFCLWKFSDEGISWDAPFGKGRPGWHIEDTAITEKEFGSQYDIHGGAVDLIFPHHEAEIAQMESISNKKPFVKYWMHTGFLDMKKEKMSKSVGNIITIRELLKKQKKETIRFFFASQHYRNRIEFSEEILEQSKNSLKKINDFITNLDKEDNDGTLKQLKEDFYNAMDDDFNTQKAITILYEFMNESNKTNTGGKQTLEFFKDINNIFKTFAFKGNIPKEIDDLAKERELARESKDWNQSDKLRSQIESKGYHIEDRKNGYALSGTGIPPI
ncbi:cysteine--tRNA ligase [Candidatus Woesearchaeota archaeon]|jgi:cysteinyl-tRNA synthetase|nr:cysteine--tRNA ligase [Candidatus Woesearchaeota archaeon]MBT6044693.1 cysteine--tRNA ligase [Candidatus Woesearchaeota archaeon]